MIQIRKANPKDIEHIHMLSNPHNYIDDSIEGFMVCEVDGVVCGCGCSIILDDGCYIGNLAVAEAYRKNGYGSTIVKALLNIADLKGTKDAYAIGGCKEFFIKLDFEEVEEGKKALIEKFSELYGKAGYNGIYHVKLQDYFTKPCKGTC